MVILFAYSDFEWHLYLFLTSDSLITARHSLTRVLSTTTKVNAPKNRAWYDHSRGRDCWRNVTKQNTMTSRGNATSWSPFCRLLRPRLHYTVFKRKRYCFVPISKRFASTLIVFVSFSPLHSTTRVCIENVLKPYILPPLLSSRQIKVVPLRRGSSWSCPELSRFWRASTESFYPRSPPKLAS